MQQEPDGATATSSKPDDDDSHHPNVVDERTQMENTNNDTTTTTSAAKTEHGLVATITTTEQQTAGEEAAAAVQGALTADTVPPAVAAPDPGRVLFGNAAQPLEHVHDDSPDPMNANHHKDNNSDDHTEELVYPETQPVNLDVSNLDTMNLDIPEELHVNQTASPEPPLNQVATQVTNTTSAATTSTTVASQESVDATTTGEKGVGGAQGGETIPVADVVEDDDDDYDTSKSALEDKAHVQEGESPLDAQIKAPVRNDDPVEVPATTDDDKPTERGIDDDPMGSVDQQSIRIDAEVAPVPSHEDNQEDTTSAANKNDHTAAAASSWASNMQMNAAELLEAAAESRKQAKKPVASRKKRILVPSKSIKRRGGEVPALKRMAAKSVLSRDPSSAQSPEFVRYLKSTGKEATANATLSDFIAFRNLQAPRHDPPVKKPLVASKERQVSQQGKKRPPSSGATKSVKKAKTSAAADAKGGSRLGAKEIWSGPPSESLPDGWTKKVFERMSGATKGTTDSYWYSPVANKKFRSMKEVERFLTAVKQCNGDEEAAWRAFKGK